MQISEGTVIDNQADYWVEKLELLKTKYAKTKTYRDLADELGVTEGFLSHVRSKRYELPLESKLKILGLLGGDVTDVDYSMLFSDRTISETGKTALDVFDPTGGRELQSGFWVQAIKDVKQAFRVESDYALAKSLKITPSMISAAKKGKGTLSSVAKLKILDKLAYTATRSLLLDVLPPKISKRLGDYDNLRFVARGQTGSALETTSEK